MARSPIKHRKPVMGLLDRPYGETCMSRASERPVAGFVLRTRCAQAIMSESNQATTNQSKYFWVFVFVVLVFAFYWFQIRPTNMRRDCDAIAQVESVDKTHFLPMIEYDNKVKRDQLQQKFYSDFYKDCLHSKGLRE